MRMNPDQGTQFAQMLVADDEPLADINQVLTCRSTHSFRESFFQFILRADVLYETLTFL